MLSYGDYLSTSLEKPFPGEQEEELKKLLRRKASATFVKLVNRAHANGSPPTQKWWWWWCLCQRRTSFLHRSASGEEIIGMEDLEQTLHVNVKSEIIFKLFGKIIRKWFENKWEMNFGNNLAMFFRNYLDGKLCMGSMRRQPEYQIPTIILSLVLTKTSN